MNSRDLISSELQRAAIAAAELLDQARQELAYMDDPTQRRVQMLKIQKLAVERDRCLAALFAH